MYKEDELRALLSGRRILIAGYGREGKSSERLIRQLCPDAELTIAEGNDNLQREAEKGYDLILKSPGIPTFVFEGHCDLSTISSQTDLFLQVYHDQVIGVTGTKGKSTTTALIAAMLRTKYPDVIMAGNMGIPLFDIIPQIREGEPIVCEFSCHQLENIHCGPHIAVLLNLHQEHLDHYHSYEDYKLAKMQIYLKQGKGDLCYYNDDDPDLHQMMERIQSPNYAIPRSGNMDMVVDYVGTRLQGEHNRKNIAIAWQSILEYHLDEAAVTRVVRDFIGLEHRMEEVGTFRGVTFYNDSISTIPAATIAACEALKEVDTLILGGFDRGIDYEELTRYLEGSTIRNLVFVGEAGKRMREGYRGEANVLMESDYEKIVPWCYEHTQEGRICLLSPAAASYDQFKNFEERGRVFKSLVSRDGACPVSAENAPSGCETGQAPSLLEVRHYLHEHPELSGQETATHDYIVSCLRACAPTRIHEHVGGNGVVAVWGEPRIGIRGDIDALPIGHRCGHDGHTAILLRLAQMRPKDTLLLFQPAEETGQGAKAVIESGVLQQYPLQYLFGFHNIPGYPLGQILLREGTFAMASTGLEISLTGRPTHASTPELGLNPGLAVSELIPSILRKSTSQQDGFSQATLIFVHLGEPAFGTSAGSARLGFTLRAETTAALEELLQKAYANIESIAQKHGLQYTTRLIEPFPATVNSPEALAHLKALAPEARWLEYPFRWSEDFGQYPMRKCFFGIGAGEACHELHHPDYDFPDALIEPAALFLSSLVQAPVNSPSA